MVQAARSGRQNIGEGSKISGTSKKSELKLTNVARGSLEELRLDYEDFLRQRGLPQWERKDPRRGALIAMRPKCAEDVAEWARQVHDCGLGGLSGQSVGQSGHTPQGTLSTQHTSSTKSTQSTRSTYAEIAANGALALIAVASALLDRQIASQASAFEREGGFTERLYRVRKERRDGKM